MIQKTIKNTNGLKTLMEMIEMNTDKKTKLKELANRYMEEHVIVPTWILEALVYDNLDYHIDKTKEEINKLTAKLKQMEQI